MNKEIEYPSLQKDIILKEYGRNIQNIVEYILTIEDREKRNIYAQSVIEMMKMINPNMKDTYEHMSKLWDQLYIISNYQLDIDSPYPMPDKSAIGKKPNRVEYNTNNLRFKHYGKNIELIIDKVIKTEDEEEKGKGIIMVGKLMKRFYSTWNKENSDDVIIIEQMKELSHKKLDINPELVKAANLFDVPEKSKVITGPNSVNYNNSSSVNTSNAGNYSQSPRKYDNRPKTYGGSSQGKRPSSNNNNFKGKRK